MPNGLVSETSAGADDDAAPPGWSPVPEVAHEARKPLAGIRAASREGTAKEVAPLRTACR